MELGPDAWTGPGTRDAMLLAAGGLLSATEAVLNGEVDNAFALLRPPGHHCERAAPMGFCLFNNTAIAARWAQREGGVERVAILDWDVHHGNGTEAIFLDDPSVLTISLHQDRLYPPDRGQLDVRGTGAGEGANVNIPLPAGTGDDGYAHALDEVVAPVLRAFRPDVLLVGAGQDASATDPLGRMSLTVHGFRALADRAVGARRRAVRRTARRDARGRLLADAPAARQPGDPRGARGRARHVHRGGPGRRRRPGGAARRRARGRRRRPADAPRLMIHDAHGFWIAEAGSPPVLPPLEGDASADVVVVGGGYTGLWTAWHVLAAVPDARVVVLEAGRCGHGPSGRNGGFVSSLDLSLPTLCADYGDAAARAWVDAAGETVDAVGAWCEAEGVDAWYRRGGELCVATAPAQDGAGADALDGATVLAQSAADARARCASPVFRAACSSRAARPCTPRGSRSACATGWWRAARGSTRAAARPASTRCRAGSRSAPPRGACAPARRCWRSTRRPARSGRCATA